MPETVMAPIWTLPAMPPGEVASTTPADCRMKPPLICDAVTTTGPASIVAFALVAKNLMTDAFGLPLVLIVVFYGILFELYTPGWGVGGTVGVICLVLGFFAMSVLPINYVGLALIVIALTMFVAEAFVPSYGFLTLGGVVCLVLGGVMLVDSPAGFMHVVRWQTSRAQS
jgi:membrane-bound ClpP family serine protease